MLGLTQYNLCREDGEVGEGIIRESLHFTKMENSMNCKSSLSVKVEPSGFVLILNFFLYCSLPLRYQKLNLTFT